MALFESKKGSLVHLGWVKFIQVTAVTSHFIQL